METKLYSVQEVSDLLRVTRRTLYTYMKQGKIHATKIGKYWYISQEQLDEFLKGDKQI